ncbi:MAG: sulfatase, partial [Alphaproteobacteria bacterium]
MAACMLAAACERPQGPNPADAWKPNIIVIAADALSPTVLSVYGGPVPTPNLDRLAREGVVFTRGYSAAAASGPARAALMTGRYPQRFGFEFDHGPAQRAARERLGLPPGIETVAQIVQQAGYNTYAVGVWHLGGNTEFYPTKRGFHDFFGVLSGETAYISPRAPDLHFAPTKRHPVPPARPWHHQVVRGPASQHVLNDDVYLTDALGEAAVDFVRANGDRPFFLYLAFNAPGEPLSVTTRYYQRFAHVADDKLRVYYAMISAMDDAIGRLLAMVDSLKKTDNTLVVFTAATGCAAQAGVCACQPLRGGQPSFYEGGVRVPLIMRWPAALPAGARYDGLVSTIDIAPTALTL